MANDDTASAIRITIMQKMREIAAQQGKVLGELNDDLPLVDSGLDSLCIAILVASLDDQLDLDPFSGSNAVIPVTFGDFVRMCELAGV